MAGTALKLDWLKILGVKTLQIVLDNYPDVFAGDLGTVKGVEARIHINPNATPVFHKVRSVPFSLRGKVEEELEQLQQQGVIEPVQFSDWVAPIVQD